MIPNVVDNIQIKKTKERKKGERNLWFIITHIFILLDYDAWWWFWILPLGLRCLQGCKHGERKGNHRVWYSCSTRFCILTFICKCLHSNSPHSPFLIVRVELWLCLWLCNSSCKCMCVCMGVGKLVLLFLLKIMEESR